MLSQGRIPMSDDEHEQLEQLLDEHGREGVTLTRRDPGNSGPLLVQLPDGQTIEIDGEG